MQLSATGVFNFASALSSSTRSAEDVLDGSVEGVDENTDTVKVKPDVKDTGVNKPWKVAPVGASPKSWVASVSKTKDVRVETSGAAIVYLHSSESASSTCPGSAWSSPSQRTSASSASSACVACAISGEDLGTVTGCEEVSEDVEGMLEEQE